MQGSRPHLAAVLFLSLVSGATSSYCVAWHVNDHAVGNIFQNKADAEAKYQRLDGGMWAEILEDGNFHVMDKYGGMSQYNWNMLYTWCHSHLTQTTPAPQPKSTPTTPQPNHQYCVAWHVNDHAVGSIFQNKADAEAKYQQLDRGMWAEILEDGNFHVLKKYGGMSQYNWNMLYTWCHSHLTQTTPPPQPKSTPTPQQNHQYCVAWHVTGACVGNIFQNKADAEAKYQHLDGGMWAEILEDGHFHLLKRYGGMSQYNWNMLYAWCHSHLSASDASLAGERPLNVDWILPFAAGALAGGMLAFASFSLAGRLVARKKHGHELTKSLFEA